MMLVQQLMDDFTCNIKCFKCTCALSHMHWRVFNIATWSWRYDSLDWLARWASLQSTTWTQQFITNTVTQSMQQYQCVHNLFIYDLHTYLENRTRRVSLSHLN